MPHRPARSGPKKQKQKTKNPADLGVYAVLLDRQPSAKRSFPSADPDQPDAAVPAGRGDGPARTGPSRQPVAVLGQAHRLFGAEIWDGGAAGGTSLSGAAGGTSLSGSLSILLTVSSWICREDT